MASLASARLVIERSNGAASTSELLGESAPFGGEESDVARLEVAHAVPLDALVFYRGLLDRIGSFNDTVPLLDDWDFTLRLARAARFAPDRRDDGRDDRAARTWSRSGSARRTRTTSRCSTRSTPRTPSTRASPSSARAIARPSRARSPRHPTGCATRAASRRSWTRSPAARPHRCW